MDETDLELLARYRGQHAEDAFTEIVRRHIDLVHSAALRQVRSPQLAEEVVQSTFINLARHAHRLAPETILTAWLYQVTRREAIDVIRREGRRQLREEIAMEMNAINAGPAEWTNVEPMLDDAMQALDESDRAAVLLRYFENKSLREVGQMLGTSDDAAQKRVSRAVDRLREFLAKRGVIAGASFLVSAISANAIQAAPAGLVQSVSVAAIAKGAVASASTLTLIKGALGVMVSKQLKLGIGALVLIFLASITIVTGLKMFRTVLAESTPKVEGAWEGTQGLQNVEGVLKGEQARTRIVVRFFKTNGVLRAMCDLIDTTPEHLEARNVAFRDGLLRVEMSENHGYEGRLSEDATEIIGTLRVGNISAPLSLKRTTTPSAAPRALAEADYLAQAGSDLQGRWDGILGNGRNAVRVVAKISEPSPGNFRAELDNLSGPWLGQPLLVSYEQRKVRLTVASRAGMFDGTLADDGSQMTGNWVQGGRRTPSRFWRADR